MARRAARPTPSRDRRAELWHSPLAAVRAALAPGASVSARRRLGAHEAVDVRAPEGDAFTLTIDGATGLPRKVSSRTEQTNLGDALLETEFADYRPAGALRLPALVTSRLEHEPLATVRVSHYAVNAPTGELAAPPSVRAVPPRAPRRPRPPRSSRPACGCSGARRITACSSSSPTTSR